MFSAPRSISGPSDSCGWVCASAPFELWLILVATLAISQLTCSSRYVLISFWCSQDLATREASMPASDTVTTQKNSCVRCFRRKVKCSKTVPASSHCARQDVECVYQEHAKRRRLNDAELESPSIERRFRSIRSNDFCGPSTIGATAAPGKGYSYYGYPDSKAQVPNDGMWMTGVDNCAKDESEDDANSDVSDNLIFGAISRNTNFSLPRPETILKFWQLY